MRYITPFLWALLLLGACAKDQVVPAPDNSYPIRMLPISVIDPVRAIDGEFWTITQDETGVFYTSIATNGVFTPRLDLSYLAAEYYESDRLQSFDISLSSQGLLLGAFVDTTLNSQPASHIYVGNIDISGYKWEYHRTLQRTDTTTFFMGVGERNDSTVLALAELTGRGPDSRIRFVFYAFNNQGFPSDTLYSQNFLPQNAALAKSNRNRFYLITSSGGPGGTSSPQSVLRRFNLRGNQLDTVLLDERVNYIHSVYEHDEGVLIVLESFDANSEDEYRILGFDNGLRKQYSLLFPNSTGRFQANFPLWHNGSLYIIGALSNEEWSSTKGYYDYKQANLAWWAIHPDGTQKLHVVEGQSPNIGLAAIPSEAGYWHLLSAKKSLQTFDEVQLTKIFPDGTLAY